MTALSAAEREEVQAELDQLREKRLLLQETPLIHPEHRAQGLARYDEQIARLERLLAQ